MSRKDKNQDENQTKNNLRKDTVKKSANDSGFSTATKNIYTAFMVVVTIAVVATIGILIYRSVSDYVGAYLKVGDYEISKDEYDFYYNSVASSYTNSGYASYFGLDTSVPFDQQKYAEGVTWDDYFAQMAVESIQEIYAVYDAAIHSDMEYDIDKMLGEEMDEIEAAAANADMSVSAYIKAAFGDRITVKKFKSYLEKQLIANKYAEYVSDNYQVTDDMLEKEYENSDRKANYYFTSYRSFSVSYATDSDATDEEKESYQEEIKAQADAAVEKITDEESYKAVITEMNADVKDFDIDESTLVEKIGMYNINSALSSWMLEDGREAGDVAVVEGSNSNYYIVYLKDIWRIDSDGVSFRHILLSDDYAEQNAETMLNYWKEHGADEDTFAEMANRYTTDTGSKTNGGLYENCYDGEMVTEVNDWIYDESRKPGDTGIVKTSYGYHIMYFVENTGELYIKNLATQALQSDYWTETKEALVKNMKVVDVKGKIAYLASSSDTK